MSWLIDLFSFSIVTFNENRNGKSFFSVRVTEMLQLSQPTQARFVPSFGWASETKAEQSAGAVSMHGAEGKPGQKQLSADNRHASPWGTPTLMKRTLRETVEVVDFPSLLHTPPHHHTQTYKPHRLCHCWMYQIMISLLQRSLSVDIRVLLSLSISLDALFEIIVI